MTTQEIVTKLWNLCNILRDDGITYQDYVTELTWIATKRSSSAKRRLPDASPYKTRTDLPS